MNAKPNATFILRCAILPVVAIGLSGVLIAACDSSSSGGNPGVDVNKLQFDLGGEVVGINDAHCATAGDGGAAEKQPVNAASCHPAGGGTAPSTVDGGSSAYGLTMYNNIGNDDDCKYLVRWTATNIAEKQDVYFQIVATATADNSAVTGAAPLAEVFLDDTHPAPKTTQQPYETTPGTYVIGPVQFDAPGNWTVRFHLHEDCADTLPDSPHGHAAFYVGVP